MGAKIKHIFEFAKKNEKKFEKDLGRGGQMGQ